MSNTLRDLFDQIIHSERKAQERKNYLHEVKTKLSVLTEELSDCQDETKRLRGQLLLKVQNWKTEELKETFLSWRESILKEEKQTLEEEKNYMEKEKKEVQADILKAISSLCTDIEDFTCSYDLVNYDSSKIEMDTRAEMEHLLLTQKLLEDELEKYDKKKSEVEECEAELEGFNQVLEQNRLTSRELDEDISSAKARVASLEQTKQKVSNLPVHGNEFKMLHNELESMHCEELETRCNGLQKELCSLQLQLRQKVLQQQQHQRLQDKKRRFQPHSTAFQNTDLNKPADAAHLIQGCTSNKMLVTNFSSNLTSTQNDRSKEETPICSSIDFEDDDFDDDMTLPDIKSYSCV